MYESYIYVLADTVAPREVQTNFSHIKSPSKLVAGLL